MPARLVSVINMKGGVGKSTTTVSLAETLAAHHRRRVLVIDLDPQTNASIMVAGPEKWNALREKERTLDFYFESYIIQQKPKPFKSLIETKVSDLKGKPDVALIAAAPEFRIVERDMIESFVKRGFQIDMIQKWICERFANGLKTVINDYDYILIDCPPGISLFAEAALIAADAILVPTIPDYVSRLGLITFRKAGAASHQRTPRRALAADGGGDEIRRELLAAPLGSAAAQGQSGGGHVRRAHSPERRYRQGGRMVGNAAHVRAEVWRDGRNREEAG